MALLSAPSLFAGGISREFANAGDLMNRLVAANDRQVEMLLAAMTAGRMSQGRQVGYDFAMVSAAYCAPGSRYHHDPKLPETLNKLLEQLFAKQSADGTLNFGNLESPPDTAFLIEIFSAGAIILAKEGRQELAELNAGVKRFMLKCGEALTIGGVHTPNHRWVICAALSRINALYPNPRYLARINEWLSEGIYQDEDGDFPERSKNYSTVEDNSLITMARLLNLPALFLPVRKNLEMIWYYTDPDGELITTNARRQDQYGSKNIIAYYLHYRYMAIHEKHAGFAAVAGFIESLKGFEDEFVKRGLFHFMEDTLLQKELPAATQLNTNFERVFTNSHLLRIRRGGTTATLFGGADFPIIIASGRSNSPNFFSYTRGEAVLKYLRLSTNFFSTGYFYSEGLSKKAGKYVLHQKLKVPYYQPLPKNLQNAKGDYKLSPSIDDRFWNKMDFSRRPVSNVKTLETTVSLTESAGKCELDINISGPAGVQVTLEFCFREGGKLSGVSEAVNGNSFLSEGMGKYSMGKDEIEFGPGLMAHKNITGLEGERYSTHFGTLRTEGMHVYVTGLTPFKHVLRFS